MSRVTCNIYITLDEIIFNDMRMIIMFYRGKYDQFYIMRSFSRFRYNYVLLTLKSISTL